MHSQNKKDMFFNRKHLLEYGYKVMGIDTHSNKSCYHYVKYFDEHNSMVVFSTIHHNTVNVYFLTPEQYQDFHKGNFALSHDGNSTGRTPSGYDTKITQMVKVFEGGEMKYKTQLKYHLDKAETLAQKKEY